jgi:hypothetical protein
MKLPLMFLCGGMLVLCMGCEQTPRQSMDEAKEALVAAKKVDAETYAPSQLQAAQVAYDLALSEISEENKKLPFMRKYHKIGETLRNATSAARSAEKAAGEAQTRIKTETAEMIARLQATIDSLHGVIRAAAAKKKDTAAAAQGVDSVNTLTKEAATALGAHDLLFAKEKATVANDRLVAVVKSVEELLPPKKGAKKK